MYGAIAYNGEKINEAQGRLLTTNRIYNDGSGTINTENPVCWGMISVSDLMKANPEISLLRQFAKVNVRDPVHAPENGGRSRRGA